MWLQQLSINRENKSLLNLVEPKGILLMIIMLFESF